MRASSRLLQVSLVLLMGIAGAATAQSSRDAASSADRAAIAQLQEKLVAGFNAHNPAAVAGVLADDAVVMLESWPVLTGKRDVEAFYESIFKNMERKGAVVELSASVLEVEIAGDWAYVLGEFRSSLMLTTGSDPVKDSGRFLHICRRQPDGSWKITRAISNWDAPALDE